jgi:hypothetical protein
MVEAKKRITPGSILHFTVFVLARTLFSVIFHVFRQLEKVAMGNISASI